MTPAATRDQVRRMPLVGVVAAVATGVAAIVLNARDQAQEPPTDLADAVATFVAVAGIAVWLGPRWVGGTAPATRVARTIAGGAAAGAVLIGLASVVYDPWAGCFPCW